MSTTTVVKLGGEVIASPDASQLCRDLAAIRGRLVVVHGGGPQATALSTKLGIATTQVAGQRVTDAETLDVVKMVVAGKLNVDLCALLAAAGLAPVGLHGAVRASRRTDVELGLVGAIASFDLALLERLWTAGRVPVLACLGNDGTGGVFNINADDVCYELAASLRADHLFVVTGIGGVRRDVSDAASLISHLTPAEAKALLETVSGGMVPKLGSALRALDAGLGAVHIIGPRDLGAPPGTRGTTVSA